MAQKQIRYFEPGALQVEGRWYASANQAALIPGDPHHKVGDQTIRGPYRTHAQAFESAKQWCKEANEWQNEQC